MASPGLPGADLRCVLKACPWSSDCKFGEAINLPLKISDHAAHFSEFGAIIGTLWRIVSRHFVLMVLLPTNYGIIVRIEPNTAKAVANVVPVL